MEKEKKNKKIMPKHLQKSLQKYISKLKKQTPHLHISHSSISATTSRIFSGCKHPMSLSFSLDSRHTRHRDPDAAATLADIDRFLSENFRSLFAKSDDEAEFDDPRRNSINQNDVVPRDPFRSHPPFFMSPASSSTTTAGEEECVAVLAVTPSPYEEFRRSMEEVVEARVENGRRVDLEFMEEMMFSYLRMNEKKQYKYILSAFVDVVVGVRQSSGEATSFAGGGN